MEDHDQRKPFVTVAASQPFPTNSLSASQSYKESLHKCRSLMTYPLQTELPSLPPTPASLGAPKRELAVWAS